MTILIDEVRMSVMQRIQDFINGELQVIADELRDEVVDAQYQDYLDEMYLIQASYYGYGDIETEWDYA